jgi:hypothetical protein
MRKEELDPRGWPLRELDKVTFCNTVLRLLHIPPTAFCNEIAKPCIPQMWNLPAYWYKLGQQIGPREPSEHHPHPRAEARSAQACTAIPWLGSTGTDESSLRGLLTFARTHIMLPLIRTVFQYPTNFLQ